MNIVQQANQPIRFSPLLFDVSERNMKASAYDVKETLKPPAVSAFQQLSCQLPGWIFQNVKR